MKKLTKKQKRTRRNRYQIKSNDNRARLSVFRSNKNLYAQIIDDVEGKTLAAASSSKSKKTGVEAAQEVGKEIAEKAKKAKVKEVVFDRGGYKYHGQVKALAESARENGLEF